MLKNFMKLKCQVMGRGQNNSMRKEQFLKEISVCIWYINLPYSSFGFKFFGITTTRPLFNTEKIISPLFICAGREDDKL